ncbi:fungal-specific transcription factor domain-containing protein [Whalleya microplaca]|nr:fungal-specific transcription factor domain-containing protein [Whalleya microplaca]
MSSSNSIRDQSSEISQSTGLKRFRCTVPGCAKVFVRREHLTRHLKSHGSNPEYACHICERKFARSDVLKRHVDFHPQYAKTKRTPVACKSCHDTKLRCDGNTPCGSCIRKSIHCIRAGNDGGSDITRQTLDHESSCGSTVMEDVSKAQSDSDPVLSNNDGPHWFQSSQGNWSLQPLPIGGNTSFPGNTPADGLKNWAVEAGGHTGSSLLLNTPIEAPSLAPDLITLQQSAFPSTTEGQGEKFSNTHSSHSESTPPSSVQNQRDHGMNLKHYIKRESATTDRLVALYFMEVHPYWPFLHAPTFNTRDVPDLLFASMAILVSCLEGEHDNPNLTSLVFDQLSIIHMHPDPPLHTLQALLLCVLYCTCHLSTEGMLIRALSFHGILVSVCRCSGVLSGQYGSQNFGHDEIVSWITEEQMHRLAFSVLRIDAYLSLLSDQPPLIRYHELSIPLPKSSQLWAAAADKERRRLQWNEPAGREKALFCFLIRDILDASRQAHLTCHLSEIDYHIGLCAMQSATWEAAREAHISASAELGLRAGPEDLIALRRNDLKVWREIMEEDTQAPSELLLAVYLRC